MCPVEIGEPNLSQLAEEIVTAAGEDIRVSSPGVVVSYDARRCRANIQPAIRRAGATSNDPIVQDVPIAFPRCGSARLVFPLEEGDDVLLVFSDRTLEQWQTAPGGRTVTPTDARTHDLTDALAIPISKNGIPLNRISSLSLAFENGGELELTAAGIANLLGTHINLGTGTEPLLKGTTVSLAIGAYCTAIASAYSTWQGTSPPTPTSNGAFITALATATATLAATLASWLSAKASTE